MKHAAVAAAMVMGAVAAAGAQPAPPGAFRHERTVTVTTPGRPVRRP